MFKELNKFINFFDIGDLKFVFLIIRKNIKNLIFLSLLLAILVFIVSLNTEKRYVSVATIVISPEENNIVNIEEVYSIENQTNRVNNQVAILKSDEVLEFILEDKKKQLEFERLYSKIEISIFQRLLKKKVTINKDYIKNILSRNFQVVNVPRSDVLKLKFTSNDPRISQLALKSIISSYQRYEVDSKIQITNYAKTKIASRLEELVKQIDIAEKDLSKYKKKIS